MARPSARAIGCNQGCQQGRSARKGSAPTEASPAGIGSTHRGGAHLQGRRMRALLPQELSPEGSDARPPTEGSGACRSCSHPWAGRSPMARNTTAA
ncbi:hypothetical protein GW17_00049995 [Ensete ventricosum]|nr:hypothetical protein GW17_00049995 [Ensete ventricosum]